MNTVADRLHTEPAAETASATDWPARTLEQRLAVLRAARHRLAEQTEDLAAAISPQLQRTKADTLANEVLPLLDAVRFLEREAASVLRPRRLGSTGRPLWLFGVAAEIHREPYGHILVIGPANFPLFLAGAHVVQALAAGNTVTWKPGAGGEPVARIVAQALYDSGLPHNALTITDDSIAAAQQALAARPDKVIFTGSAAVGHELLTTLAATATPAVVELSSADAVIVLPTADLRLVAEALTFGLRMNGSQVCMSPRRLFLDRNTWQRLRPLFTESLRAIAPVALNPATAQKLEAGMVDALSHGAVLHGELNPARQRPLLIENASPQMSITSADLFAPVLSVILSDDPAQLPALINSARVGLTTSIFCAPADIPTARALGAQLRTGTVLINDLIAPTADPRVPFTARSGSGYGATRGREGLLEMTVAKTYLIRRRGINTHYLPTTDRDLLFFQCFIRSTHAASRRSRIAAFVDLIRAARRRNNP